MYLIVLLRYLLGLMPWVRTAARWSDACRKMVVGHLGAFRGPLGGADSHVWMSMDYVLNEGYELPACARRARGPVQAFARNEHPISFALRLARRLAGRPRACPALAVSVPRRDLRAPRR